MTSNRIPNKDDKRALSEKKTKPRIPSLLITHLASKEFAPRKDETEGFGGGLDKTYIVTSLSNYIAKMPSHLIDLLNIPDGLYYEKGNIYTSHKNGAMAELTLSLLHYQELPTRLPDYAITFTDHRNQKFCTFVDKKRKIIVHDDVGSIYSDPDDTSSWYSLSTSISKALKLAEKYNKEGIEFNFVLVKRGIDSVI